MYIDTPTISFYVSLLGIVGMISFKVLELRSGKKMWFLKMADKANHKVHDAYTKVRTIISHLNRRSALVFVQWIAYHVLSWARQTYIWLYRKAHAHPPSKKVIDMVRGKGEVQNNGGASFYLRRISEKDEEVKVEGEVKKEV